MFCCNFLYVILALIKWDVSLCHSTTSSCFDHSYSPGEHPHLYLESNNPKFESQLSDDLNLSNCCCSHLISQHVFVMFQCWCKMKQLHLAVIVSYIRLQWCIFEPSFWCLLCAFSGFLYSDIFQINFKFFFVLTILVKLNYFLPYLVFVTSTHFLFSQQEMSPLIASPNYHLFIPLHLGSICQYKHHNNHN